MAAKRPIPNALLQRQKNHYCPDCGGPAKLFKAIPGGKIRGRCERGHEYPKTGLVLR